MSDTTIKKIDSRYSPRGAMGQRYLAAGRRVSMRLWEERPRDFGSDRLRDYETVGYVIRGRAELRLEGQVVQLQSGDSWVVPEGARHAYRIFEDFEAIEATSPPSHVHDRDVPPEG